MFVNKYVKFVEDVYPFKLAVKNGGNLFMDSSVGIIGDDIEMFQVINSVDSDIVMDFVDSYACIGDNELVSPTMTYLYPLVMKT